MMNKPLSPQAELLLLVITASGGTMTQAAMSAEMRRLADLPEAERDAEIRVITERARLVLRERNGV